MSQGLNDITLKKETLTTQEKGELWGDPERNYETGHQRNYGTGLYQNEVLAPHQEGGKSIKREAGQVGGRGGILSDDRSSLHEVQGKVPTLHMKKGCKRSEKAGENRRVAKQH